MGAIDTCLALLVLVGCETSEPPSFKPSNGLDAAMTAAVGEPGAVLPAVVVNTDDCTMHDAASQQIAIESMAVAQDNAPGICAFIAGSFDLADVDVTGSRALAFVAPGAITLRGRVDASAHAMGRGTIIGPGASGDCVGDIADGTNLKDGGGGGGNATAGGDGLFFSLPPTHRAGGSAQHGFEPLVGGCAGGGSSGGGGGGGAIQLDSEQEIRLRGSSFLALGGAAGEPGAGGSSGGNALFEAPRISIIGGIAANGGGGGANGDTCPTSGDDARDDETPAAGGIASCQASPTRGGAGGTAATAPGVGTVFGFGAGGGGAVGRIGLRTADGGFEGPGAIFSVSETTETLATR